MTFWERIEGQKPLGALLLTVLLGGCGLIEATQKIIEVVKDPEIQVGEDSDQPSVANITFFAQRNANINTLGEGVPISVLVVQMCGNSAFTTSEIFEFVEDPQVALGGEFVDAGEHTIPPGEFLSVPEVELQGETKFLGFVGLFANANQARWRDLVPVQATGKVYTVTVEIGNRRLVVQADEG